MRLLSIIAATVGSLVVLGSAPAFAEAEEGGHGVFAPHAAHPHAPDHGFSFDKPFGYFDQLQLQRGYKVYREVCSSCHGLKLLSFRNLGQPGGPFYDEAYPNPNDNPIVKQIASEYTVASIDEETGDAIQVPAKTSDRFVSPYPNDAAARGGNGGALPPDLSVIAKARHGGGSYIYSLLTGYPKEGPPKGLTQTTGQHYNPYMAGDTRSQWTGDPRFAPAGGFLAMAPPLRLSQVSYDDGTPASESQNAADVAAFLAWASEPKQSVRKQLGLAAILYLAILTALVYASYRRIWRNVKH